MKLKLNEGKCEYLRLTVGFAVTASVTVTATEDWRVRRRDDDGDKVQGNMAGDDDESDSDDISDDDISHDSDSEDSDAVSLAASSMSDEGDEIEDDEEDSEIDGEDDGSYQSGESDENF